MKVTEGKKRKDCTILSGSADTRRLKGMGFVSYADEGLSDLVVEPAYESERG